MQAVILAAGHGTRLRPLTDEVPKALVHVLDKPLIEYALDVLVERVTAFIIVTGYRGEMIRAHLGERYHGIPITYVEQSERLGTAHALSLCEEHIRGDFILMYADEMVDPGAIEALAQVPAGLIGFERPDPQHFGVIVHDNDMNLVNLEEKPEEPKNNLVSAAGLKLTPAIFAYYPPKERNGEYYLADMIPSYLKEQPMQVIIAREYLTVNRPEDITAAEATLARHRR